MTKLQQAAMALAKAERRKTAAFHEASLAREDARRALKHLLATLGQERAREVRA